jgi:flagellar motor switch protein FliN/FliY
MTEPSVVEQTPADGGPIEAASGATVVDDSSRPSGRKKSAKSDDSVGIKAIPAVGTDRLDLLSNIEMDVTAELGRTRMTVRELLSLTPGTVVELDRMAGSPIDLYVNGTLIARGEVVVIDEEFGLRISEIINPGATENAR